MYKRQEQLKPSLEKLNRLMTILSDKERDLKATIDRMGPYANALGEAVASGPNFDSLVGVSTFGDYTAAFMSALQGKYPQLWKAIMNSGFPLLPNAWSAAPPAGSDPPRPPAPAPTYPSPTPSPGG